jgi:hypothetical protein
MVTQQNQKAPRVNRRGFLLPPRCAPRRAGFYFAWISVFENIFSVIVNIKLQCIYILRQYNPSKEFKMPQKDIKKTFVIVGNRLP